jgi:hypothetical protein
VVTCQHTVFRAVQRPLGVTDADNKVIDTIFFLNGEYVTVGTRAVQVDV